VRVNSDGRVRIVDRWNRPDYVNRCFKYFDRCRPLERHVHGLLADVRKGGDHHRLEALEAAFDENLREQLLGFMADIQEMRPFLLRGFDAANAVACIGWK